MLTRDRSRCLDVFNIFGCFVGGSCIEIYGSRILFADDEQSFEAIVSQLNPVDNAMNRLELF